MFFADLFHVEHFRSIKLHHFFKKFNLLFIIVSISLFLISCKEENPNPELLDPIYSHLQTEEKEYTKKAEENKKNLEQYEKDFKNSRPRSAERIVAFKSLKKARKNQVYLNQKAKFFKIRAEHRKFQGRKSYRIAFRDNRPWPDPKEYENFLTNNRLKNTDLNWGKRVPKLFKENPNYKAR